MQLDVSKIGLQKAKKLLDKKHSELKGKEKRLSNKIEYIKENYDKLSLSELRRNEHEQETLKKECAAIKKEIHEMEMDIYGPWMPKAMLKEKEESNEG